MKTPRLNFLTSLAGLSVLALAGSAVTTLPASAAAGARAPSPAVYPSVAGRLYHVAAASPSDVWAAGLGGSGGLIAHWNGRRWTEQSVASGLQGIAAQSATNAWAVGGSSWFYPSQTVAYHWNGSTWDQITTPTPGGSGYLNGVAATSPSNAWAVGLIGGGPGDTGFAIPLILHWNGKTWRRQTFRLPQNSGEFNAVAAISATDAWAVGQTNNGGPSGALIEHWNGRKWKRIWPGTGNGRGYLNGISATGPDDVWAVGYNNNGSTYQTVALHWNGTRWSQVPTPNPSSWGTNLWDVSASSPSNAWAVGYVNSNGGPTPGQTTAFHWNGKRWSVVPTPSVSGGFDALLGVAAITPGNAWAVGTIGWSSTITEHWNGKTWQN